MQTVALINPYGRAAATTADALTYRATLDRIGYSTTWYQCVERPEDLEVPADAVCIPGLASPFRSLNLAANLEVFWPKELRGLSQDVLLVMDQILTRLVDFSDKCVIVVHDLREVSGASTHIWGNLLFRHLIPKLAKARAIITVSANTKRSLEHHLKSPPPIFVLHHTTRLQANPLEHVRNSINRLETGKTLTGLYPVVDRPYKNLKFIVDLARHSELGSPRVHFRFNLRPPLRDATLNYIQSSGVKNVHAYVYVDNAAELFNAADFLVFPSLHEGFGKPLIEAMRFGMPIIANDLEPMREVVGEGGILLPPNNLVAWGEALQSLADPDVYLHWSTKSIARSREFTEENFERRLEDIMHRLR